MAEPRWARSPTVAVTGDFDRFAVLALSQLDRPPVILEATAAAIWRLLEQPLGVAELVGLLSEEYGVATAEIRPSVERFLDELAGLGLVTPG